MGKVLGIILEAILIVVLPPYILTRLIIWDFPRAVFRLRYRLLARMNDDLNEAWDAVREEMNRNVPKKTAQLSIDKIKVVIQALAVAGPQEGLPGLLVAPIPLGGTRFHGREDAHQTGVGASLFENPFHPIFFVETSFAKEEDLQAMLGGVSFGIRSQGVVRWLGEPRTIKNPDLVRPQVLVHVFGVTEPRQCSLDQEVAVTGNKAGALVRMSLSQQFHDASSLFEMESIIEKLPSPCNESTFWVPAMSG